jgi:hypothetical protein
MSTNRCALAAFAVVVMMTAPGCGDSQATSVEQKPAASAPAQAAPLVPVLAKAHLADADAAAKKWHSDARLIQIAGRNVKDDGTVPWWEYGAYSSSAKTCVVITIIRGNVSTQESGGPTCESAALGDIIDSDQAITIARANGVTKQSVSMVVMASPNRPGHAVWSVIEEGMRNPGDITLDIDAATGKVLSTTR